MSEIPPIPSTSQDPAAASAEGGELKTRFEGKIRGSRIALYTEAVWPRLSLVLAIGGLFLLASLLGLWGVVGDGLHRALLAGFAIAAVAGLGFAALTPWPNREAALRRLETLSNAPHRPASSYEDTASLKPGDAAGASIWAAHRARLARAIASLRVRPPVPRTDAFDPFALRAGLWLALVPVALFAGDSAKDRILSAFRLGPEVSVIASRLDAWVAPPAYAARPPVMLIDAGRGGLLSVASAEKPLEVPEHSVLTVRASGTDLGKVVLDGPKAAKPAADAKTATDAKTGPGAAAKTASADPSTTAPDDGTEAHIELRSSGPVTLSVGGRRIATWSFQVKSDKAPKIELTKVPELGPRGTLKLSYRIESEIGIANAEARFEPLPDDQGDPTTAWARPPALTGPRQPLDRPPHLALKLPRANANVMEGASLYELAGHLYGGRPVRMRLAAVDHAGNEGLSEPVDMNFPERLYRNPLARAVLEQRRYLASDSRMKTRVVAALDALSLAPELFMPDKAAYLEMRSAAHRITQDDTRATRMSTIDQLWHLAERIEFGNLSEDQRRLKELQDRLSDAIKNGASPEEIKKLMQEMRVAINDVLKRVMREADRTPSDRDQGDPKNTLRTQDLDRLMRQMERMLSQGNSQEQAEQMLSELNDMLDKLEHGQMRRQPNGQANKALRDQMNRLGKLLQDQQRLMDDTFSAERNPGEGDDQSGQDQQGGDQNGQQGPQGKGSRQGRSGQGGQKGDQQGGGSLSDRQGQLRGLLDELKRGFGGLGLKAPDSFDEAGRAMEDARRAIDEQDLSDATREQGRALEALRKGAQEMAQALAKMRSAQRNQTGEGASDDTLLDPGDQNDADNELPDAPADGRVAVPKEFDAKRAREILEELRRRLGEASRPAGELEYLERLLQQY